MNQVRPCAAAIGAFLLAVFFLGPLSAPPAHAQDAQPAAPPPGKALLYIFRSDREPRDALVPLAVNAEQAGYLENGTFIALAVNPGKTFLRSGDRVLATFSFEAAADQTYFVRVQVVHGVTLTQTDINLVGEAEGRNALAQSRFIPLAPSAGPAAPPPAAAAARGARPETAAEPAVTEGQMYVRLDLGYSKSTKVDMKDEDFASTGLICADPACNTPGKLKDVGSGFLLGGGVGYRFSPHFRGDITLGVRLYNMNVSDASNTTFKAEVLSLSAMVNAYIDFAATGVSPYVGAGVGYARNSVDNLEITFAGTTFTVTESGVASGLATSLMAGIAIPLSGGTVLDIGYRYSALGKLNLDVGPTATGKLNAHELTVGFRF